MTNDPAAPTLLRDVLMSALFNMMEREAYVAHLTFVSDGNIFETEFRVTNVIIPQAEQALVTKQ